MKSESFIHAIGQLGQTIRAVFVYGNDAGLLEDVVDFARHRAAQMNLCYRSIQDAENLAQTLDLFAPQDTPDLACFPFAKGKDIERAFDLLSAQKPLSPFIITSTDVTSKSPLVAQAISHADVAAVAYYQRSILHMERWLQAFELERPLSLDREARAYLLNWLAGGTEPVHSTFERIALLSGDGPLDLILLKSILAPHDAVLDDLLDAVAKRDRNRTAVAFNEVLEHNEAIPILRSLVRLFQQLESGYALNEGRPPAPSQYLQLQPPVYFPQKARFESALKAWTPADVSRVLCSLHACERRVKLDYGLPLEVLQHDLLSLL
ncbi:MAG: hypothetical protein ACK5O7_00910 [Holosporales bacterium]